MKTKNYAKTAITTAAVSFFFGTILFISFMLSDYMPLIGIGLFYIGGAFILNIYTLLTTIVQIFIDRKNRIPLILSSLLLLTNIPVVLIYINLL
jgi:hypothetical protein